MAPTVTRQNKRKLGETSVALTRKLISSWKKRLRLVYFEDGAILTIFSIKAVVSKF